MPHPVITVQTPGRQRLVLVVDRDLEVGREGTGLVLLDARVSRRHALIEPVDEEHIRISDLGSSNGTLVDGEAINVPTKVALGQLALVGDTRIQVHAPDTGFDPTRTEIVDPTATQTSIDVVAEAVSGGLTPQLIGVANEPGTLTIAFSDIESSTERASAMGDVAWFEVLRRHTELVHAHVAAHRGRIVKNQGDGFMICFRSARQALLSMIGLQRDLERYGSDDPSTGVKVRIGLHTGEVLVDDDGDLFGRHVMQAARTGAVANGGEIVVSSLVKQIADPRGDVRFVDPSEVEFKGIAGTHTVWRVDWHA